MLARGGGAPVFTSTFVGHTVGFPGMAAYAASKAGLIGLTQVIAGEYGAGHPRQRPVAWRRVHTDERGGRISARDAVLYRGP